MVHQSSSRASIESASSETMIILESDDTVIHMNEGWKQVPEPEELDVERRLRRKYPMWWKVWRGLALGFLGMIFLVFIAQTIHILFTFSTWAFAGNINLWGKDGNEMNVGHEHEHGDEHGGVEEVEWDPTTSFTRDVVPKPLHSHNDYWRTRPLYDAISVGCISVEADVWLYSGDDELYVGHDPSSLTTDRTLSSLYITPILKLLYEQNPQTRFANNTLNGVFDTTRAQTLYLYIDIKTSSIPTFNAIKSHLSPLRTPINYLTHFTNSSGTPEVIPGPITVILTGDAPLDEILTNSTYRDYFYDAPLADVLSQAQNDAEDSTTTTKTTHLQGPINAYNSLTSTAQFSSVVGPLISIGDGRSVLTDEQRGKISKQVEEAKKIGLGVRYWDTPAWPARVKEGVWRVLVEEGVVLVNVDDLEEAAKGGFK